MRCIESASDVLEAKQNAMARTSGGREDDRARVKRESGSLPDAAVTVICAAEPRNTKTQHKAGSALERSTQKPFPFFNSNSTIA